MNISTTHTCAHIRKPLHSNGTDITVCTHVGTHTHDNNMEALFTVQISIKELSILATIHFGAIYLQAGNFQ